MSHKSLTMDDYDKLELPDRIKVDSWLDKYNLTNVRTVTQTPLRETNTGIVCLGYNVFPSFRQFESTIFTSDEEILVTTAFFDYDDFPWGVMKDA